MQKEQLGERGSASTRRHNTEARGAKRKNPSRAGIGPAAKLVAVGKGSFLKSGGSLNLGFPQVWISRIEKGKFVTNTKVQGSFKLMQGSQRREFWTNHWKETTFEGEQRASPEDST